MMSGHQIDDLAKAEFMRPRGWPAAPLMAVFHQDLGRTDRIHREAVRLLVHRKCPDSLHDGMSLRILLHRKRQRTVIGVAGEMGADQLGQLGVRLQRDAVMDDKQPPSPLTYLSSAATCPRDFFTRQRSE